VRAIVNAAKLQYTRQGRWPEDIDSVEFEPKPPTDPWGRPYHFELTEDGARAWSYGRDGEPGGEGEDADISWPIELE